MMTDIEIDLSHGFSDDYARKISKIDNIVNKIFDQYACEIGKFSDELKELKNKTNKLNNKVSKSNFISASIRDECLLQIKKIEHKTNILILGCKHNKSMFHFQKYELLVMNIIISCTILIGIFALAILIWYAQ